MVFSSNNKSSRRVLEDVKSMAGKIRLLAIFLSNCNSIFPVPLNSSKITSSILEPVSVSAVAIILKEINVGMATALPNGNLIVPVIHEVDKLTLTELTQKVNDLSARARANKLKPADLEGGTFTISNIGGFGNLMGTPIIVQPQVGILAFGVIEKKPAVHQTPLNHIGLWVDDLPKAVEWLSAQGLRFAPGFPSRNQGLGQLLVARGYFPLFGRVGFQVVEFPAGSSPE